MRQFGEALGGQPGGAQPVLDLAAPDLAVADLPAVVRVDPDAPPHEAVPGLAHARQAHRKAPLQQPLARGDDQHVPFAMRQRQEQQPARLQETVQMRQAQRQLGVRNVLQHLKRGDNIKRIVFKYMYMLSGRTRHISFSKSLSPFNRWLLLPILILLVLTPLNYTQQGKIQFKHLTINDGLSQNAVFAILQDRKGFMWFGTGDGLNRYDGYSFKVYRPEADNETSLSNSWITSITEDKNGFVWIGTRQGGLNRFDPRSGLFTVFKHDPNDSLSLSNNRINALFIDKKGALWVGTDSDLDRFEPKDESFIHYIGNEGGLNNPITTLSLIHISEPTRPY